MDEPAASTSEDATLDQPTKEFAAHITRELSWEERIEGTVFDAGPGAETERIYSLEAMSNLLNCMPNFDVDLRTLQQWIGKTVGDAELGGAIGAVLDESTGESMEEAEDRFDDGIRDRVSALLALRARQCREVLSAADSSPDGDAPAEQSETTDRL